MIKKIITIKKINLKEYYVLKKIAEEVGYSNYEPILVEDDNRSDYIQDWENYCSLSLEDGIESLVEAIYTEKKEELYFLTKEQKTVLKDLLKKLEIRI